MAQRVVRIVPGCGPLDLVAQDRRDWRQDVIEGLAGDDRGLARGHRVVVRRHDVASSKVRRAPGTPFGDEGQHLLLPLLWQCREVIVRARLEEPAYAVEHLGSE
jgi:hypothetical protein